MITTRISIAMATYNGARFIKEQLQSFAEQTRLPDELVITDDGSTDDTLKTVEQFAATAPFPIRICCNATRLGYSRNFETAIAQCEGDIIFLSDQDDVWFPDKIATIIQAFDAEPGAQVAINDQILTDDRLRHSGLTKLQNLKRVGKTSAGMIEGCCTGLRLDWARALFPMPSELDYLVRTRDLSHDRWINELAILVGCRIVIERPLQYFRRTGENTTSWVLSEPRQPTLQDIAHERQSAAPVEAWRRRIAVLDAFERFLTSEPIAGDTEAAVQKIVHERSSYEQRIQLASLPRWRRAPHVWRLWRTGGYRYFERWLSATNDLVRSS